MQRPHCAVMRIVYGTGGSRVQQAKRTHQVDVSPYKDVPAVDLDKEIKRLRYSRVIPRVKLQPKTKKTESFGVSASIRLNRLT
jgi:hypothetical protein